MHRNKKFNKNDNNNLLKVYHHNIRGLKGKICELLLSFLTQSPRIICLREHQLKDYEIDVTPIPNYKLGAQYSRQNLKNGSVSIYIHHKLPFSKINLLKHCKEQDIEICAVQLKLQENTVIILCLYRAPSGNLELFLDTLNNILNSLLKLKIEFIICGNIHIKYMEMSNNKKQLDNLLNTYNLTSMVPFPTRIDNTLISMIRQYIH